MKIFYLPYNDLRRCCAHTYGSAEDTKRIPVEHYTFVQYQVQKIVWTEHLK